MNLPFIFMREITADLTKTFSERGGENSDTVFWQTRDYRRESVLRQVTQAKNGLEPIRGLGTHCYTNACSFFSFSAENAYTRLQYWILRQIGSLPTGGLCSFIQFSSLLKDEPLKGNPSQSKSLLHSREPMVRKWLSSAEHGARNFRSVNRRFPNNDMGSAPGRSFTRVW